MQSSYGRGPFTGQGTDPQPVLCTTLDVPSQTLSREASVGFLPMAVVSFLDPALSWAPSAANPTQQYEPLEQ